MKDSRIGVEYSARDKIQSIISDAFKGAEAEKPIKESGSKICFKSLVLATIFIMMISGITSLAVASAYYAFVGHIQL